MSEAEFTPQPLDSLDASLAGQSLPSFVASGDYFYFSVQVDSNDYEYWRSDGTAEGTFALTDFFGIDRAVSRKVVNERVWAASRICAAWS